MSSSKHTDLFFKRACYFEAGLIVIAVLLGWVASINPFNDLYFSENSVLIGLIGTLPLFVFYLGIDLLPISGLIQIKKLLFETLCAPLSQRHWADWLILSAIAGISEEVLFRGVLQPWLENSWGLKTGLITSSLLFGLVHAVTPLYAILATLIGLYLGLSLDYGGHRNLLNPIIIHGFYDFLIFVVLINRYKKYYSATH